MMTRSWQGPSRWLPTPPRYSMGSSDPLPAGFEIQFGGLNFQATGNGYLMCLTNREELHARRQAGSAPVTAARVTTTQTPAGTNAAGPSASRRHRRSGQRSRQARLERRQAEHAASQRGAPVSTAAAALVGERAVSGPRFPIVLHGATTSYNANVNTTMCRVPPGRHVNVARDPSASTGDESSLGFLDALPPANQHGYAEWDISSVPDPVMFRRFLDVRDCWFGCSDDTSTGCYDPARECCVVIANDPANATGAAGGGDGEVTPAPGIAPHLAAGTSTPAGADIDAQLAQARELEAKLAEEYRTVWLLRTSMAGEASVRGERARELGIQARDRINADFNVDNPRHTSTGEPEAYCRRNAATGHASLRRGTCTARYRRLSSKRPSNRPRARRPASANRGTHQAMGVHRGPSHRCTQVERQSDPPTRDAHRLRNDSSTHARHGTVTPATSSMLGGRARRTHGRRQATTLGGVDATTAMKTALRRRNPRGPVCSAGRSARRPSPNASANPQPSSSTTGGQIPACG
jgi:hypothetical protein